MLLRNRQRRQNGDTIVEVLIAVAVVTSVLAGAFTVSQASTIAVRDSQERGEALQLLQGQVELVRAAALKETSSTTGIFDKSNKYFCMRESGPEPRRSNFSTHTLPPLDSDNFSAGTYGPDCQKVKTATGHATRYNVAITYDEAGDNTYTFINRWDGLNGKKKQQQLSYRIYPGTPVAVVVPASTEEPVCTSEHRNDIVLTADTSGSMNYKWTPTGETRFETLKKGAHYFVNNSSIAATGNNVALISFNSSSKVEQGLTSNITALESAINGMATKTGTYYLQGLNATDNELDAYARPLVKKAIIFLSDGAPSDSVTSIYTKVDAIASKGVVIHTIGIQPSSSGEAVLKNMARNGGQYYKANSSVDLEGQFKLLADELDCEEYA